MLRDQYNVTESRLLRRPRAVWEILKHIPTLDPLAIFLNAKIFYIEKDGELASFATIKKFKGGVELGTVFTLPKYRKQGMSQVVISYIKNKTPNLYLLCEPQLVPFYTKLGFILDMRVPRIIEMRREAFNKGLSKIFGYKLVSMRAN